MLRQTIDAYLSLRRAVGFRLDTEEYLLRDFARWAGDRGEFHVQTDTALEWAALGPSAWQREKRLRVLARFARHARTENPRHEVLPTYVFARRIVRRPPHIYTADQVKCLMEAASQLPSLWPLRPEVFTTLFGLLASSGLRVSEALALRFEDVTTDGLVIRKTKFGKTRLVPLHPTATVALDQYLTQRLRISAASDYVFISAKGGQLPYWTVNKHFLQLARETGLRSGPGSRGLRLHDLRHTFAVRVLENCPGSGSPVGRQARALSTYLGHVNIADTCWYLSATPQLMRGVANACEHFLEGGAP